MRGATLVLSLLFCTQVSAQIDSVFYVSFDLGLDFSLDQFDKREISSFLVNYDEEPSFFLQAEAAMLVTPNVGLYIGTRYVVKQSATHRFTEFNQLLSQELEREYYILGDQNYLVNNQENPVHAELWLGLHRVFKSEAAQFKFGTQIGIRSFSIMNHFTRLKQINSNNYFTMAHTARSPVEIMPTWAFTGELGIPISSKVMLHTQVRYALSWADIQIDKEFYNQFTQTRTNQTSSFNQRLQSYSFSLGITICLNNPLRSSYK